MGEHLLVRACRGEMVERTPVWAMRQAGRWDPEFLKLRGGREFYEFSASPELAAQASLLPRRFGVDGIILFYDITTLAVAMGMKFTLEPNRGPVPEQPIRSHSDVSTLSSRPDSGAFAHVVELLRIVRRSLDGTLPILVFASAPFTLASYCVGTGKDVARTNHFIREQPKTWASLSDKITEATIAFLDTLCREGANAYQLFDSWAGELGREVYERWSLTYHQQILSACQSVPSILFVRECPHLDLLVRSGANVVSLGTRHKLDEVKMQYANVSFQGNVDHELLARGTVEEVRAATQRCLHEGAGQRHVLNLNHGVDRATPVENFAEFVRTARN
jgi:uroporphyrinogen decarboxylase